MCCGVLQGVAVCDILYFLPLNRLYNVIKELTFQNVCCSVLQCVAVCCSVLQHALRCVAVCCGVLRCVAICDVLYLLPLTRLYNISKGLIYERRMCVAACCSVLQCVAVCCSVLQCVAV